MKKVLLIIICTVIFISCNKNELSFSNRPFLHEKFNGKYELISSVSEKAVDLNNDGIASKNLLDENSMVLFSSIVIGVPIEDRLFMEDNEFAFSEFWPTENDHRLRNKEVIKVYKTLIYSGDYDIYGNFFIGKFKEDLSSATFRNNITDDGKNTLIELKSFDILKDETIKVTVTRKLYTMNGWITTEIESLYKRQTIIT